MQSVKNYSYRIIGKNSPKRNITSKWWKQAVNPVYDASNVKKDKAWIKLKTKHRLHFYCCEKNKKDFFLLKQKMSTTESLFCYFQTDSALSKITSGREFSRLITIIFFFSFVLLPVIIQTSFTGFKKVCLFGV